MTRAQTDLFEELSTSSLNRLRTFAECAAAVARRELKVASQQYLSELIADVDLRQVSLYAIFEAANRVEGKSQ